MSYRPKDTRGGCVRAKHIQPLFSCQWMNGCMSYHNRNVPVLCTIEMSPSCRFTKPQKRSAFSFADIDFFSTDDQAPECRIWVSGMGARGKGQGPFPRSAV